MTINQLRYSTIIGIYIFIITVGCKHKSTTTTSTTLKKTLIKCDSIYISGERLPIYGDKKSDFINYTLNELAPLALDSYHETGIIPSSLNLTFIISEKGEIIDVDINNDINQHLKQKLKSKLLSMPQWTPGSIDGRDVCMKVKTRISCLNWK